MATLQQIQEEMRREAAIDRKIENFKKKFLKLKSNKKYKFVPTRKESNIIIVFNRVNLTEYNIVLNDDKDVGLKRCETDPNYIMLFLKNKNPRDTRSNTLGDITRCPP